jgi:molybdenum cofactor cytidylyltransferase
LHGWSALILAGGAGRRFGGGKLLASLAGQPVIRRVVDAVVSDLFTEVLVVTGADDAAIRQALGDLPCRIIHAPDWAEGMAATLRTGVAAISPNSEGVCVFLGDMPLVPDDWCGTLIAAAKKAGYAARPSVAGKPGHPVAFTRAAFVDLLTLTGDQGATALLKQHPGKVAYCETDSGGVLFDIDTPADLAAAERAWKACATSATSESAISRGDLPKP